MSLRGGWRGPQIPAPWVTLAGRLIVGSVFITAGLAKIGDPLRAVETVQAYQILPASLAALFGYIQPTLGIMLGLLLVAGLATRIAALLTGLLLIAFIGGVLSAWARGLSLACGCFGGGGPVAPGQTRYPLEIFRDVGLLALVVIVAASPPGALAIDRSIGLMQPTWALRPRLADLAWMRWTQWRQGEAGNPAALTPVAIRAGPYTEDVPEQRRRRRQLFINAPMVLVMALAVAGALIQLGHPDRRLRRSRGPVRRHRAGPPVLPAWAAACLPSPGAAHRCACCASPSSIPRCWPRSAPPGTAPGS
jgi:uncharacterized membrane protein YphA (DoxX/SURF4 family)